MKTKSLLLTIAFMIFAISMQAQVKPKPQVKNINKQKVVTKSGVQVKGTFKDTRDGKIYKTVKIGTQTWMAENLAYKVNSGCWAYDEDITNVAKYGYLYDWETAKTGCPTGWHLPSDAEWTVLTTYLGGEDVAGIKMKSTSGWNDDDGKSGNGNNASGFAGLPSGYRDSFGTVGIIGGNGNWWSSTVYSSAFAWYCDLSYSNVGVFRYNLDKRYGLSVRCLMDL